MIFPLSRRVDVDDVRFNKCLVNQVAHGSSSKECGDKLYLGVGDASNVIRRLNLGKFNCEVE